MIYERVHKINQAVREYFEKHPEIEKVPAKELMPEFIEAGIYEKDHRNGLPIRKDLRELDSNGEPHRIPSVLAVRKNVNTNWYFMAPSINRNEALGELKKPVKTDSYS